MQSEVDDANYPCKTFFKCWLCQYFHQINTAALRIIYLKYWALNIETILDFKKKCRRFLPISQYICKILSFCVFDSSHISNVYRMTKVIIERCFDCQVWLNFTSSLRNIHKNRWSWAWHILKTIYFKARISVKLLK